jgi:hypothetical protein
VDSARFEDEEPIEIVCDLPPRSALDQSASMDQEIDCKMPSISSQMLKRIPESLPISDELKSSAIRLEHEAGVAWPRAEALAVVAQLDSSIWAILGGDVLKRRGVGYTHTYDSWHSDPARGEKCPEFVARSHRETRGYIERFPETTSEGVAYSLVFAPCEGRLLDLT